MACQPARSARKRRSANLRALHYRLIGRPKPNGLPYTNTDPDWVWLGNGPARSGRWLGYIGFKQIIDARNSAPVIRPADRDMRAPPEAWISSRSTCRGSRRGRPFALCDHRPIPAGAALPARLFRREDELGRSARPGCDAARRRLLHAGRRDLRHDDVRDGRGAEDDGRPLVVLTFCDSDPAGWQMPISISRKLQALRALEFHDLRFQVRRVGLTPAQVREYGLPSTPLKDTERRADRWKEATGTEQTEVDALLALRPICSASSRAMQRGRTTIRRLMPDALWLGASGSWPAKRRSTPRPIRSISTGWRRKLTRRSTRSGPRSRRLPRSSGSTPPATTCPNRRRCQSRRLQPRLMPSH